MSLVLHVALSDERIRAVLLIGSRADVNSKKDILQDFDIVYIVRKYQGFLADKNWINVFGERLLMQLPNEMSFGEKSSDSYHYLMLFKDGNRIDLTLLPVEKCHSHKIFNEPHQLLLDKDKLFENISPQIDNPFLIQRPTQKEFADCCNEFWWVSINVAKGLWRNEIVYAKAMMDGPVRSMFLQLIEWYVGAEKEFSVSIGKNGRYLERNISPELYQKILLTYPDSEKENNWKALFLMTETFEDLATVVATKLNLAYNKEEGKAAMSYLQFIRSLKEVN